MSKHFISIISIIFISFLTNAQESVSKKLKGKVIADSSDLESIYIVNLKTNNASLTERGGYFEISASVGDTIMFSSVQFKGVKIALKKEDFEKELLFVKMETLMRQLDEVKIMQYKGINAVSLGIVPKGIKVYTPAERKLYTATTGSGLVSVDGILNMISGRTAMLKKEAVVEKKEQLIARIGYLFEDDYFTDKLKIPSDYVKGFQFYLVEDVKFAEALKEKNKIKAQFLMGELAIKYLELINHKG